MQDRTIAALLTTLILFFTPSGGAFCQPDRYGKVLARVYQMRDRPFSRVMQVGVSEQGRPLVAVVLTDPENPKSLCSDRIRVLVLCSQHGDEPSPVKPMLDLAAELSQTQNPFYRSMLKKVVLIAIPVVNPDGFAHFRRCNANGVDLNRNWSQPNQPETLAVSRLVAAVRPHVVIDQHEWLDNLPGRWDGVETAGFGRERHYKLGRLLAGAAVGSMPRRGASVEVLPYRRQSNHSLAHRHFAQRGICSLLVEMSPRWSPQARYEAYRNLTLALLAGMAFPRDQRTARAICSALDASKAADSVIADLYTPNLPKPVLPVEASYCLALFLLVCWIVVRYAGGKGKLSPAPDLILYSRRLSLSDVLGLRGSARMKVAIIRLYRSRPSDRVAKSLSGRPAPSQKRTNRVHTTRRALGAPSRSLRQAMTP